MRKENYINLLTSYINGDILSIDKDQRVVSEMKKNTYSLILSENVVAEIDRIAHQLNTNRSGLVNRILAEYVSYETPELKTERVFEILAGMLRNIDGFRIMPQPSANVFVVSAPLAYKYNPTVRYSVEMYRSQNDGTIGNLRVSLRTRSDALGENMHRFFALWSGVDESCCCSDNRFSRCITSDGKGFDPEKCARDLYDYVTGMDAAMRMFFSENEDDDELTDRITEILSDFRH